MHSSILNLSLVQAIGMWVADMSHCLSDREAEASSFSKTGDLVIW